MVAPYRMTMLRRLGNFFVAQAIRLGLAGENNVLLSVPGRRSGRVRTTPVTLIRDTDRRWLVGPYGAVNWVKNARVAGEVTLSRGRHRERVGIRELPPDEAAPVLKRYINEVPIVRPYFAAAPDAPLSEFVAEADRHPVFLVVDAVGAGPVGVETTSVL